MCHTRNCPIFYHYCINGLYLATFLGFKISTNIAVIEICDNARANLRSAFQMMPANRATHKVARASSGSARCSTADRGRYHTQMHFGSFRSR